MAGRRLGSYRVVSCIGEGGMGTVYRAEHVLLGRFAAVKVLHAELSRNQDMVDRFFNEARATAQLRHPGIVDVLDFGTCEDGAAFIVMELLCGESLTDRLVREERLPWPRACGFARQIAQSLAAAHRAQIVHRDLKPDNVFLVAEPDRAGDRTKVLDFGIAKLADASARGSVKTRADLIMGTPTYMSPQQCRGAGQVDHRADIYSLGCILFEMVCGRPPFVGEGFGDLLSAHITMAPPPPRQLATELPEALERLILRMLAKAEVDRPQSMEAIADELEAIMAADGTAAEIAERSSREAGSGDDGRVSRSLAVTTVGGGAGQLVTTAPWPHRGRPYAVLGAAAVGAAGIAAALAVFADHGSAVTVNAPAASPPVSASPSEPPPESPPGPPPERTGTVALPQPSVRLVRSTPPGAQLLRGGEVLGTTPLQMDLSRFTEPQSFTLRLAGYLDRTIEIAPDRAGTTEVVLKRVPRPVVHELECDGDCEVVLDGQVVGIAAPGRPYRVELLEREEQVRTYVLRLLDNRQLQRSLQAAADRPLKARISLRCTPQARTDASVGPRVFNPYCP